LSQLVNLAIDGGVARIEFNRPEVLNALDVALATAFRDAVETAAATPGIRCFLLAGAGRAFLAGGDVASFGADFGKSADVVDALLDALHPAILALRSHDAPVVAAVRGVAAGAGLSLALNADYLLAEEAARFVVAYDKVGAAPDCGGTWFLPRRVGRGTAMRLMLLGEPLTAQAALGCGIADEIVAGADLDRRAAEIAARIASGPTRAYGNFKRLVDAAEGPSLAEHLEAERRAFRSATRTADFREGVTAFIEKRKPVFRGE